MKLDKIVLANAFALTTAILWIACSTFVFLFPNLSLTISKWLMHGLDVSIMGSWNLTLSSVLFGGVTLVVSAWATGWVFGWSWKKASGKKKE